MSEPQDNQNKAPFKQIKYFGMAIDPIHIGTGGYRLGRVDNSIARDPATNLPILFGSSIEGTARTYSAYKLIEDENSIKAQQDKAKEYLHCAGKSVEDEKEDKEGKKNRIQCGKCEICVTYGFSKKDRSLHGMAQFSDAKLLFFPVHTMIGPVWVTCPGILKEFEITIGVSEDTIRTNLVEKKEKLNLGWIYLENEDKIQNMKQEFPDIPGEVLQRLVLVSDKLFPNIVNSNLDVRTSVSIDPITGAAEEGALFTYEAIPRGTVMHFTVTFLNPANFDLKGVQFKNVEGNDIQPTIKHIEETVEKGLVLFEHLGIGGMGTRGFGRFEILNLKGDKDGKQSNQ
jgi:CRISPR-associated protein Cmr4